MSMRNYGIYNQGAFFKQEDFDPVKVILAVMTKIDGVTPPDNIMQALTAGVFDETVAAEICEILDVDNKGNITDYQQISDILVSEVLRDEWFDGNTPIMGTDKAPVSAYTDIEGDFVFDNDETEDEYVEECYVFSLRQPFVWDISEHKGFRTRNEVVGHIKEAAAVLLKDDIDWDKRLGYLIGSTFG